MKMNGVANGLSSASGKLKEAVDVLEMALRRGAEGDTGMLERAIAGLEDLLEKISSLALSGAAAGKKPEGISTGRASRAVEGTEAYLSICLAQCDRAVSLLSGGDGTAMEGYLKSVGKRVEGLRRLSVALELSRRLRAARKGLGLSQAEAAERMEISPAYLSRIESVSCNPPSRKVRRRIEAFLHEAGEKSGRVAGLDSAVVADSGGGSAGAGGEPKGVSCGRTSGRDGMTGRGEEEGGEPRFQAGGAPGTGPGVESDDHCDGFAPADGVGAQGGRARLVRDLLAESLKLGEADLGLLLEVARHLSGSQPGPGRPQTRRVPHPVSWTQLWLKYRRRL